MLSTQMQACPYNVELDFRNVMLYGGSDGGLIIVSDIIKYISDVVCFIIFLINIKNNTGLIYNIFVCNFQEVVAIWCNSKLQI